MREIQHMTSCNPTKPFIKKFSHEGCFYVYDVNTNQVVEVEKSVYEIIDDYEDDNTAWLEAQYKSIYPISQLRSSIEKIKKAKKELELFSNFKPKRVALMAREPEQIKELHDKGLQQMLLQLTRDCTLNCSYCFTSGKYADAAAHQSHMSKEICLKAVDFFCQKSRNFKEPVISFYGGESLLKFDLMKEAVQHVKRKYDPDKYSFNITTNGTILDKEIIDFFVENDFKILISLDGPQKIQNRYRISRDGKGSFHRVMENLAFLKQYNSDFFFRNISIYSVLAPPFEFDEIISFFSNDKTLCELRNKGKIRSSMVDTRETTFLEDFDLEERMDEYRGVFYNLVESLKKLILAKRLDKIFFEKNTIFPILKNLAQRPLKKLYEYMPPLGTCHIGLRRVFVSTGGDFYICERVIDRTKIGSVDNGFDYETIAAYYRKLEEVLEDCKNCWAILHCERCWAHFDNLDEFNGKNKEEFCSSKKKIIEIAFKAYTELLREDPDCFKVFEDVVREPT
jgi:uncharacterized protein